MKKKKKERKTPDRTHLAHANWADFVQRRQKEREGEREIRFPARCGHCVCKRPMQKTAVGRSIVPVLIEPSSWPADHRVTKLLWTRMYRVNVKKKGEIVDGLFVECVLEC